MKVPQYNGPERIENAEAISTTPFRKGDNTIFEGIDALGGATMALYDKQQRAHMATANADSIEYALNLQDSMLAEIVSADEESMASIDPKVIRKRFDESVNKYLSGYDAKTLESLRPRMQVFNDRVGREVSNVAISQISKLQRMVINRSSDTIVRHAISADEKTRSLLIGEIEANINAVENIYIDKASKDLLIQGYKDQIYSGVISNEIDDPKSNLRGRITSLDSLPVSAATAQSLHEKLSAENERRIKQRTHLDLFKKTLNNNADPGKLREEINSHPELGTTAETLLAAVDALEERQRDRASKSAFLQAGDYIDDLLAEGKVEEARTHVDGLRGSIDESQWYQLDHSVELGERAKKGEAESTQQTQNYWRLHDEISKDPEAITDIFAYIKDAVDSKKVSSQRIDALHNQYRSALGTVNKDRMVQAEVDIQVAEGRRPSNRDAVANRWKNLKQNSESPVTGQDIISFASTYGAIDEHFDYAKSMLSSVDTFPDGLRTLQGLMEMDADMFQKKFPDNTPQQLNLLEAISDIDTFEESEMEENKDGVKTPNMAKNVENAFKRYQQNQSNSIDMFGTKQLVPAEALKDRIPELEKAIDGALRNKWKISYPGEIVKGFSAFFGGNPQDNVGNRAAFGRKYYSEGAPEPPAYIKQAFVDTALSKLRHPGVTTDTAIKYAMGFMKGKYGLSHFGTEEPYWTMFPVEAAFARVWHNAPKTAERMIGKFENNLIADAEEAISLYPKANAGLKVVFDTWSRWREKESNTVDSHGLSIDIIKERPAFPFALLPIKERYDSETKNILYTLCYRDDKGNAIPIIGPSEKKYESGKPIPATLIVDIHHEIDKVSQKPVDKQSVEALESKAEFIQGVFDREKIPIASWAQKLYDHNLVPEGVKIEYGIRYSEEELKSIFTNYEDYRYASLLQKRWWDEWNRSR